MKYSINPLTTEILDQQFDSFIQTLENLKDTGNPDKDRILELFRYTQHDSQYFVAQKDNGEIIGTIKTIIEPKLIRWGVFAGKIEDVSVREGYEGMKIGSALMEAALQYCKEKEVYKITLTAKEKVVGFYEKYGFERYSINMKKYCK